MKITSWGAAGEVTGSKHLIESEGRRILLDCGMFQGRQRESRQKNSQLPFEASSIDALILSHGHLDHCGSIPLLVKKGFRGKIYTTSATYDVADLIMRDSAKIQVQDADYWNRHLRREENEIKPIYTEADVDRVAPMVINIEYGRCRKTLPGIEVCLFDAGHILGSALVHLTIKEGGQVARLGYTGDLGQQNMPILREPARLPETDILICESTYGARRHESAVRRAMKLTRVVQNTVKQGGKIFVPAFALGRTQTLIYSLHKLTDTGVLPRLPIYVDSPLAVNMTKVFSRHPDCFDKETRLLFTKRGEDPFGFRNLTYIRNVEESKALNTKKGPMIILATSGMIEAGRILHHLKNGLADSRNTLLIVGYMAYGTLGRRILEGAKSVSIFRRRVQVRASVEKINAYSAHADQAELVSFVKNTPGLKTVFLIHGDEDARLELKTAMGKKLPCLKIRLPQKGREYALDL